MAPLTYSKLSAQPDPSDPGAVAPYLFWLMMRNVATDGYVFRDPLPWRQDVLSTPGCIIASPSWENSATHVTQDYVYNWTRDAAIVAVELACGPLPNNQSLVDYVAFAQRGHTAATAAGHVARASFLIDGTPRQDWTDQNDGPALQTIALLQMFAQLDPVTQGLARDLIAANLSFLVGAYPRDDSFNLWEEHTGASFFTRAVQLRCFQAIESNTLGIPAPPGLGDAVTWLTKALDTHWTGTHYQSLVPAPTDRYDPNIDVVLAAVYGAVPVTDTRLLATAALLRSQWEDVTSGYHYPINAADHGRGIGPLLGRYPGDTYDGDSGNEAGDHPWAISTAAFAELYYRLATHIGATGSVPLDGLSAAFFGQVDVDAHTTADAAAAGLRIAGDKMLRAVIFHSDHLELSEQFDATTGYEKSVSNLSWSYAAYLSANRARTPT